MNRKKVHQIAKLLRKMRLLDLADFMFYIKDRIGNLYSNKEFLLSNRDFPVPPPHLAFDAYATTNWQFYFKSGLDQAQFIANIINENILSGSIRILEWGCGPGRIIRHLGNFLKHQTYELYGSDYNRETIAWCQKYLKGISFSLNELKPPFPYESNFFDCIFAISVFTHLSEEMHFAWIKELYRVLKPNGVIIITTHGDISSKDRLLLDEKIVYDSGKLVTRGHVREGKKWYLAYHPQEFVRTILLKDFKIISSNQGRFYEQDLWVAKKYDEV
jgi:SAM-dependent methyltransferase